MEAEAEVEVEGEEDASKGEELVPAGVAVVIQSDPSTHFMASIFVMSLVILQALNGTNCKPMVVLMSRDFEIGTDPLPEAAEEDEATTTLEGAGVAVEKLLKPQLRGKSRNQQVAVEGEAPEMVHVLVEEPIGDSFAVSHRWEKQYAEYFKGVHRDMARPGPLHHV